MENPKTSTLVSPRKDSARYYTYIFCGEACRLVKQNWIIEIRLVMRLTASRTTSVTPSRTNGLPVGPRPLRRGRVELCFSVIHSLETGNSIAGVPTPVRSSTIPSRRDGDLLPTKYQLHAVHRLVSIANRRGSESVRMSPSGFRSPSAGTLRANLQNSTELSSNLLSACSNLSLSRFRTPYILH